VKRPVEVSFCKISCQSVAVLVRNLEKLVDIYQDKRTKKSTALCRYVGKNVKLQVNNNMT